MKTKIENLKKIISENSELKNYTQLIQEGWNAKDFDKFVKQILIDFVKYNGQKVRPEFYTKLQTLFNIYNENNKYPFSEFYEKSVKSNNELINQNKIKKSDSIIKSSKKGIKNLTRINNSN